MQQASNWRNERRNRDGERRNRATSAKLMSPRRYPMLQPPRNFNADADHFPVSRSFPLPLSFRFSLFPFHPQSSVYHTIHLLNNSLSYSFVHSYISTWAHSFTRRIIAPNLEHLISRAARRQKHSSLSTKLTLTHQGINRYSCVNHLADLFEKCVPKMKPSQRTKTEERTTTLFTLYTVFS